MEGYRARGIAEQLSGLDAAAAGEVEVGLLTRAAGRTSGQLRAAALRAVFAVDPAAARKRREKAQRDARVEMWREPSGTASIAGRDLPPAEGLAADKRIDALARQLKKSGADGTLDQLRAGVYVALLTGTPLDELLAAPGTPASAPGDPASPGTKPPTAEPTTADPADPGARPSTTRPTTADPADPGARPSTTRPTTADPADPGATRHPGPHPTPPPPPATHR